MTDAADTALHFELGRIHSDGRSEVIARLGAHPVHSHVFNLLSSTARTKFIAECRTKFPGLQDDADAELDRLLLRLGDEAAKRKPSEAPAGQPRSRAELERVRDAASQAALEAMPDDVVAQAEQMLADPQLVDRVQQDLGTVGIVGEEALRLAIYSLGTSRKLDDPLAGIVLGPSSAGKSHAIERVGGCFPDEDVLWATDLTPQALYYVGEDALVHTLVLAGERSRLKEDQRAETTRALREVISAKVLHKVVPEPDESGRMVTRTITRHGPIAFVESTTLTKIFDEDKNRALLLAADESPEQTRRVIGHAAQRAAAGRLDTTAIIQRQHALQRLLRRVNVRVPFAEGIGDRMPSTQPEARRAIGHTLSVIQAVALLHQRQRSVAGAHLEHGATIDATLSDYAVARELLIGPLGQLLGSDLTPAIANFGRRVVQVWSGRDFTAAQAAEQDSTIKVADVARRYLGVLATSGIVEVLEGGRGGKSNVYRVVKDVPEAGAAWLPTVEALRDSGVDRLTPGGHSAGPSGRQLGGSLEATDPSPGTGTDWRPAVLIGAGTSGRQPDPGRVEQDTLATCRTAGDQTGWSPADGADDRDDHAGTASRDAGDQATVDSDGAAGRTTPADLGVVERTEAALRRAIEAEDEGAAWLLAAELARLIGQEAADAVEGKLRGARRERVDVA